MEEIKITVPNGMEIDKNNSNLENGVIKFKKKEIQLPKTWDEVSNHQKRLIERRLTGSTPDKYESLMKLEILRDIYRQEWVPDWNDSMCKYSIIYYKNELSTYRFYNTHRFLSFQSKEIRDKFLNNFKELIEECKDFI